jgi:hypothetical protein
MKPSMVWIFVVIASIALHAQWNPYEAGVQQKFVSGGTIRMHLSAGSYTVSPTDSDNIVETYHASSAAQLSRVKVKIKPTASSADIYIQDTPHNNFTATVEIPRRSNLWARLTAGELNVEDIEGDKDVEIWAGQLDLEIPHPEQYGHRDASVVAGSVEASAFNISKGGLFRSFQEQGPGRYCLHAHVTTGEIDLRGTRTN